MKVLLRESIVGLGSLGEVVKVAAGYGRNFLLPQGKAVAVTASNLARLEHERKKLLAREAARKHDLQGLAARLAGVSCNIPVQSNAEGRLYGAVTPRIIADALRHLGHEIESSQVLTDQPIRELGVYDVTIRLHAEVDAQVKVWVIDAVDGNSALDGDGATKGAAADETAAEPQPATAE